VPDAIQNPVCVLADERGRVAASVGSCAIEITGNGDRRHSARWSVGEFLFERVGSRLALVDDLSMRDPSTA
jgi:hypothetical protein